MYFLKLARSVGLGWSEVLLWTMERSVGFKIGAKCRSKLERSVGFNMGAKCMFQDIYALLLTLSRQ